MPPDLVRTHRRVGPDVEEGRVVGGPGRAVVNALDDVPQVLAGVEVPEAELVQLRSVDVGRIGEEIFVRAPLDVAELEVVVAFRELVGVENDLLGGVHRPTAPAVDLVVEAFHRPGVGQPTLEQGRRGGVRLLDPPDDLAVQTFLEVACARRHGVGIGIFGFEVGDHLRVVLVTQPVVGVDASVPIGLEDLGTHGGDRRAGRGDLHPLHSRDGLARAAHLEGITDQPLDLGPFGVGRRAEGDEPSVLSAALQEPTPVVKVAAPVEEQRRVIRERAYPDDVGTVDCVAGELPHHPARARLLHRVRDLFRLGGGVLDRTDRRSHYRPHTSGNLVHLRRNARRGICPACHVSRLV